MSSYPWEHDAFKHMLEGVTRQHFFEEFHENKSLHSLHDDPKRYSDLLSIDRIDEVIANSELPPEPLRMARSEPSITRSNYTFSNGNIDRGAVVRHYQQGATIILPQLHLADEVLAHFCRALEKIFSTHVQTNIYLTPPNNKGFDTHYDDHDVFVMQISGKKNWKLYRKPIENPYRGENFKPNVHEAGEVIEEFVLNAGDCVYIPRGLMHDASTIGDEASLHVTVGMIVKSWADLMLEALSEVALRKPEFRRSLPPGFAEEDYDIEQSREYFNRLVDDFKAEANFDEVFELFVDQFVRTRGPDFRGGVSSAQTEIKSESRFQRRSNSQALLRSGEDSDLIIVCGGGDVHFDGTALDGVEAALSGNPFGVGDFSSLEEADAVECIKKLLAFGVIEKNSSS